MSMEFKVYLQAPDGLEVIRRIRGVGSNYVYLRKEICSRFSLSDKEIFSICWKDNEGDKISISSNQELEIALIENNFSLIKLYVTLQGKQDYPKEHKKIEKIKNVETVHTTVTCDECHQTPLYGYRYKCLVCHNYDLCTHCEKSGRIHSEHPMIRIPVAINGENPFGRKYHDVKANIYGTLKNLLEST